MTCPSFSTPDLSLSFQGRLHENNTVPSSVYVQVWWTTYVRVNAFKCHGEDHSTWNNSLCAIWFVRFRIPRKNSDLYAFNWDDWKSCSKFSYYAGISIFIQKKHVRLATQICVDSSHAYNHNRGLAPSKLIGNKSSWQPTTLLHLTPQAASWHQKQLGHTTTMEQQKAWFGHRDGRSPCSKIWSWVQQVPTSHISPHGTLFCEQHSAKDKALAAFFTQHRYKWKNDQIQLGEFAYGVQSCESTSRRAPSVPSRQWGSRMLILTPTWQRRSMSRPSWRWPYWSTIAYPAKLLTEVNWTCMFPKTSQMIVQYQWKLRKLTPEGQGCHAAPRFASMLEGGRSMSTEEGSWAKLTEPTWEVAQALEKRNAIRLTNKPTFCNSMSTPMVSWRIIAAWGSVHFCSSLKGNFWNQKLWHTATDSRRWLAFTGWPCSWCMQTRRHLINYNYILWLSCFIYIPCHELMAISREVIQMPSNMWKSHFVKFVGGCLYWWHAIWRWSFGRNSLEQMDGIHCFFLGMFVLICWCFWITVSCRMQLKDEPCII